MARSKARSPASLPHLDDRGFARMVDVGEKPATRRVAIAEGYVRMKAETLALIEARALSKGDALAIARIAGIAGTKRTADLIPLAHPIGLTHVSVEITPEATKRRIRVEARAETVGPTGVEMEALVAVTTAALSIYDLAKAHERGMVIEGVRLLYKAGGRSGTFRRPGVVVRGG